MTGMKPVECPERPEKGTCFWVPEPNMVFAGMAFTVTRVNGRSFYVYSQGKTSRYLRPEWTTWVKSLFRLGDGVELNGHPVKWPDDFDPADFVAPGNKETLVLRENRLKDARERVLPHYFIHKDFDRNGVERHRLTGLESGNKGDNQSVTILKDWSSEPFCTCVDSLWNIDTDAGPFCKHLLAILMKFEHLHCQLLDVVL